MTKDISQVPKIILILDYLFNNKQTVLALTNTFNV